MESCGGLTPRENGIKVRIPSDERCGAPRQQKLCLSQSSERSGSRRANYMNAADVEQR